MGTIYTRKRGEKPNKEQLEEIKNLSSREITIDDDCPELTANMKRSYVKEAQIHDRLRGLKKTIS